MRELKKGKLEGSEFGSEGYVWMLLQKLYKLVSHRSGRTFNHAGYVCSYGNFAARE